MKWPNDQIAIMEDAFQQFLANCGHTLEDIRTSYAGTPPMKVVYAIERQVIYDLQNDNTHPAYSGEWDDEEERPVRVRKVEYNPNFVLYPPGCHDRHRETMLRHIGKRVGLLD